MAGPELSLLTAGGKLNRGVSAVVACLQTYGNNRSRSLPGSELSAQPMKEISAKIHSHDLRNRRTIWLRIPHDPLTPCPLIIFLDGEFYRDQLGANAILDRLRKQRRIGDAWIVFVSMHSTKTRARECPCHRPFAKLIASRLLSWLERRHPEIRKVTTRVLIGLSYTGLAAAYVAITHRGLFDKVVCQSGSFWWKNCWLPRNYASRKTATNAAFFLDVGKKETQENIRHSIGVLQRASQIEGVRRFRDALKHKGNVVKYVEFNGGHEFKAWAKTLPQALQWALHRP